MSRESIDLGELEMGIRASEAPSVVHEAVAPETGQGGGGCGSNMEGSASTVISHAVVEDDIAPEHDVGQVGLARFKSTDPQFNFYPIFQDERAMIMESSVMEIDNLSRKMRRLRKSIKAKHGVEPQGLSRRQRDRKRWEMLSKRMKNRLKESDAGFVTWKAIDECARPQPGALKMLQHWIGKQPGHQWKMYSVQDVDLFRLLGPERGPIERFVHEFVPATDLADYVLRPFRSRFSEDEEFEYRVYLESTLDRIATAVALLLTCVFLLMPLAVLAFFGANRIISVSLVLAMAVLVFFLAESMEKNEGRRVLLSCAYLAVMGMFVAQSS